MMGNQYPQKRCCSNTAPGHNPAISTHRISHVGMILTAMVIFSATLVSPAHGQLTGIKNVPGDFPTLDSAIIALNLQGVGLGGVTINVLPGNTQTAPPGGYVMGGTGSLLLTSASMSNQVIFQGNSNTIIAPVPQSSGVLTDALIKIIGADWITISGFMLTEHPTNQNESPNTNDMTEWGIALFYVNTSDGAQNITIQNNTIDLDRTYPNTFGIYANATHAANAPGALATAIAGGGNNGLKIFGNHITDVNQGIVIVGPTAAADHQSGIVVGAVGNGNMITNYGTSAAFSDYINISTTVNGILVRNTKNYVISGNSVTSSNGGVVSQNSTIHGIQIPSFSNPPTGTFTNTISHNSLSVKSGIATGPIHGINVQASTASAVSTLQITHNLFNNFGHTAPGTTPVSFILNSAAAQHIAITNNEFHNLSVNTAADVTFIANEGIVLPVSGSKNVNDNVVVGGFTKSMAGGNVIFLKDIGGSDPASASYNIKNNIISNITVTGATTVTGIQLFNTGSPSKLIQGNTINQINGGNGAVIGITINSDGGITTVSSNTLSNIISGGSISGINLGAAGTGTTNVEQNLLHSFTTSGFNLAVTGIVLEGNSTTSTRNVYQNKIYNLENTNTQAFVYGIRLGSGFAAHIYNNLIGDLRTPFVNGPNSINGINISSNAPNTSVNIFFNTVYLNASSTGPAFGSSGIFQLANSTATTASLSLRNNIIVNLSTPKGTGITAAFRRSSTALGNYHASSDNNLFYAGTPGTNRVILLNGATVYQTLDDFKNVVTPRDANSVTENPPFLSLTGGNAGFLHINPASSTQVESGAVNITGITKDFDNDTRQGNAGYSGQGTAPDIGADEGDFQEALLCDAAEGGTASGSVVLCGSGVPNITAAGYSDGIGSTYQWQSSTDIAFTTPFDIPGQNNPAVLTTGTVTTTTYYRLKVTCSTGQSVDYSNTVSVIVNGLVVENTNDSNSGSLRDIINCASPGSTITFAPALAGQTITLTSGQITISKNLTIQGLGSQNLTISGNNTSRIFHLTTGANLTIKDLTLTHATSNTNGGAILAEGNLILHNIRLLQNFENGLPKPFTLLPPGSLMITGQVHVHQ